MIQTNNTINDTDATSSTNKEITTKESTTQYSTTKESTTKEYITKGSTTAGSTMNLEYIPEENPDKTNNVANGCSGEMPDQTPSTDQQNFPEEDSYSSDLSLSSPVKKVEFNLDLDLIGADPEMEKQTTDKTTDNGNENNNNDMNTVDSTYRDSNESITTSKGEDLESDLDDLVFKVVSPPEQAVVDKTICDALRSCAAAYNAGLALGNMDSYKAASYNVRKAVKEAKQRYGRKLESQLQQSDSRTLWQGLRTITDYKAPTSGISNVDASLADELNIFHTHFKAAAINAKANAKANANVITNAKANASGCRQEKNANTENAFIISKHDVRRAFRRVNTRKAAGPDGISGRVLRAYTDQLAPMFTEIFNLSLIQSVIPTCFKESIIVPVPKKTHPASLNDYRPVALTSVVMTCLERLVRDFIISSLPDALDPLQFAYRPNRSTDDANSHLLHTSLTHLDTRKGNYVKMLFVDYNSVFITIIPSTLTTKLQHLGLSPSMCQWISNFLTGRPQAVRMGRHVSASFTLSTGAPQGCVLSPLLYSLYTYDCVATTNSTTIIKFADDTGSVSTTSDA
ncbi:hypothetical protein QTP70_004095 [Hemibagrus guttatus]|uniref:Reverse transcriptase domain-containing protein n=1 Tax=Hemibagrus guttatus TaxID=175788 RepID=A0AAE0UTD5_9TELE|nr:hypothetical protein QTP70_004095 [Hemibagrus guttatus]